MPRAARIRSSTDIFDTRRISAFRDAEAEVLRRGFALCSVVPAVAVRSGFIAVN
jgi:hypothetical protein